MKEMEQDDWKFVGLLGIQMSGLALAFAFHSFTSGFYKAPNGEIRIVWIALIVVLVGTITVFVLSDIGRMVFRHAQCGTNAVGRALGLCGDVFATPTEIKPSLFNLSRAARCFGLIDLLALAVIIRLTGGSERSLFTPFLFLVPAVIALLKICLWKEIVLGWGTLAAAVFVVHGISFTSLALVPGKEQFFTYCFLASTTLCAYLALSFYCFDRELQRRHAARELNRS